MILCLSLQARAFCPICVLWEIRFMSDDDRLTTAFGAPVPDNQNSQTAGNPGPVLLQDYHLIEKLAHFNRERIPERVVHAKGAGAHGYFEVTRSASKWSRAAFLSEAGKRTPALVRFSTVAGEKGSADTVRDPRGFALKLYTEEGNYDLVMNNTPVFFIRDPLKFPDFIHSQKRNPATNCPDPDAVWDFFSLSPESLHQVIILFSDRGIPKSYRQMNGYSGHTFMWVNEAGEAVWVKYHFKTESGIAHLAEAEARRLAGEIPDYHTRDLYEHIARGGEAAWKAYVQIMPLSDADSYRFDPFDLTKVWSHKDYPLEEIGRLVLNRNPDNYFAEVEQAAFSPGNIVPGVQFSPDKMLQGRIFAYGDAHRYRLGANFHLLRVNAAQNAPVCTYLRDAAMRVDDNGGGKPNYEPNSQGGPRQAPEFSEKPLPVSGEITREGYRHHNNNYTQPGDLFRLLHEDEQSRLIENLAGSLGQAKREYQIRQLGHFYHVDESLARRLAVLLKIDLEKEVLPFARDKQPTAKSSC